MLKKVFTFFLYFFAVIGFAFCVVFVAVSLGWTNTTGIIDNQRSDFLDTKNTDTNYWETLPEWTTLHDAIVKDKDVIQKTADDSGVSARLIVSALVVEQMRFFFDDRESFKKFFEPLKILGSQTKFSWGIMGVKKETALDIEAHLKNTSSPFYPGSQYEHTLDFKTADVEQERFTRMTDQHNHYYGYVYAGLYMKQVMTQWKSAGYDISDKPEILVTLYNIGFANSKPNPDPHSGGAAIPIGDKVYSFGSLAGEFYNSSELLDEFPR